MHYADNTTRILGQATIRSGRTGSVTFKDHTLVLADVSGRFADPKKGEINYQALSAAKTQPHDWHTVLLTGNPSLSTIQATNGWTWYLGDYPTGSGGHGSGTGIGHTEMAIRLLDKTEDWYICVIGGLNVSTRSGHNIQLAAGQYIKVTVAGPTTNTPQPNTDRDVAKFLQDVKAELLALGLTTNIP